MIRGGFGHASGHVQSAPGAKYMSRWLIAGSEGTLGPDLVGALDASSVGGHAVTATERDLVDMTDPCLAAAVAAHGRRGPRTRGSSHDHDHDHE